MSKILLSLLFLFSTACFGQTYYEIDERVRNYPQFKSLNDLGIRIQNDFSYDEHRIRAAFSWIAQNIRYEKNLDEIFQPHKRLFYSSEFVKNQQIKKLKAEKIQYTFQNKRGVCIDYTLMLEELLDQFGLKSKVIVGIFKTDIKHRKDIKGSALFKNHSWNAVLINGQWKLMDVTIASGYYDATSKRFVRKFNPYYFFTLPMDLSKTHFPANNNWQLSNQAIDLENFYNAPIYFPSYFMNDVQLAKSTKGTCYVSDNTEFELNFDHLPKRHLLYYQVESSNLLRKVKSKKNGKGYISKIKLDKHFKDNEFVTLFLENKAILNFKIQKDKP